MIDTSKIVSILESKNISYDIDMGTLLFSTNGAVDSLIAVTIPLERVNGKIQCNVMIGYSPNMEKGMESSFMSNTEEEMLGILSLTVFDFKKR